MKATVEICKIKSLHEALMYCEKLESCKTDVLIDLQKAEFIDSNFTALLGAYIYYLESKNINVAITKPEKWQIYTTLCKNNFLPFFSHEFKRMNDNTSTTIEFRQFDIADTVKLQNFYDELYAGLLKSRGLNSLS